MNSFFPGAVVTGLLPHCIELCEFCPALGCAQQPLHSGEVLAIQAHATLKHCNFLRAPQLCLKITENIISPEGRHQELEWVLAS